jgi:hypothetical protein
MVCRFVKFSAPIRRQKCKRFGLIGVRQTLGMPTTRSAIPHAPPLRTPCIRRRVEPIKDREDDVGFLKACDVFRSNYRRRSGSYFVDRRHQNRSQDVNRGGHASKRAGEERCEDLKHVKTARTTAVHDAHWDETDSKGEQFSCSELTGFPA